MNEPQAVNTGVGMLDAFKLVLAIAALAGGVVAYYRYPDQAQVLVAGAEQG